MWLEFWGEGLSCFRVSHQNDRYKTNNLPIRERKRYSLMHFNKTIITLHITTYILVNLNFVFSCIVLNVNI